MVPPPHFLAQSDAYGTTPIYLINLLWKLGLGLWLDLELHYFSIFTENNEKRHLIFREFYVR